MASAVPFQFHAVDRKESQLTLKLQREEDVRRVTVDAVVSFDDVLNLICRLFSIRVEDLPLVRCSYIDEDGDKITVSCELDWAEAKAHAQPSSASSIPLLRLNVFLASPATPSLPASPLCSVGSVCITSPNTIVSSPMATSISSNHSLSFSPQSSPSRIEGQHQPQLQPQQAQEQAQQPARMTADSISALVSSIAGAEVAKVLQSQGLMDSVARLANDETLRRTFTEIISASMAQNQPAANSTPAEPEKAQVKDPQTLKDEELLNAVIDTFEDEPLDVKTTVGAPSSDPYLSSYEPTSPPYNPTLLVNFTPERQENKSKEEEPKQEKQEQEQEDVQDLECLIESVPDVSQPTEHLACFVCDISVPDFSELTAGQRVTKIWRMRNEGRTTWPLGTCLIRVGGDNLLASSGPIAVSSAQPGESVDIAADMIAPNAPGRYVCYFRLVKPDGVRFGHRVWVDVVVRANTPSASSPLRARAFSELQQEEQQQPQQQQQQQQEEEDTEEEDFCVPFRYRQSMKQLTGMGFPSNSVTLQVLIHNKGDVMASVNQLVDLAL